MTIYCRVHKQTVEADVPAGVYWCPLCGIATDPEQHIFNATPAKIAHEEQRSRWRTISASGMSL